MESFKGISSRNGSTGQSFVVDDEFKRWLTGVLFLFRGVRVSISCTPVAPKRDSRELWVIQFLKNGVRSRRYGI